MLSALVVLLVLGSYTVSAAIQRVVVPLLVSLVLSILRLCRRLGLVPGYPLLAIQRSFTHKVVRWILGSYTVSAGITVVVSLAEPGVMVYFLRPRFRTPRRPA